MGARNAVQLQVALPERSVRRLWDLAHARGTSFSQTVRDVVARGLDALTVEQGQR